jgi:hypothetical protein
MVNLIHRAVGTVPATTGTVLMAQIPVDRYRVWTALSGFPTSRRSGVESRI